MIGYLPTTIELNGIEWAIRSDFRIALIIFEALNDPGMKKIEKTFILLDALFVNFNEIPQELHQEACVKASEFLDGGTNGSCNERKSSPAKTLDWVQDEQFIFSAINRIAGKETRISEYIHWWTFLGYFQEIGECLLSNIMSIRQKKATGKKLSKGEQAYYKENKKIIDIRNRNNLSEVEIKEEKEELFNLLK